MTRFLNITKTNDLQHYSIRVKCLMCGREHDVVIKASSLFWLNQGKSVSEACKDESIETREGLISGMCPDCQKDFFE